MINHFSHIMFRPFCTMFIVLFPSDGAQNPENPQTIRHGRGERLLGTRKCCCGSPAVQYIILFTCIARFLACDRRHYLSSDSSGCGF